MTHQPVWEFIANLGDVDPLDYGGYFVYRDTTGVYPEEAEKLELDDENNENSTYTIYRIVLNKCTFIHGVLSDNKFHPKIPAWFAAPESEKVERPQNATCLSNVADYVGQNIEDLQALFCSNDPLDRASAYESVGDYHGWDNLDQYPLTEMTRQEVEERYKGKGGLK